MCDPITIAGLALTAGGAGASYVGQQKSQGAIDDAIAAERVRQQGYDRQAAGVNSGMVQRYEDIPGQTAAKSKELGDMFTGASELQPAAAMPATNNDIVTRDIAKKRGEAQGRVTQQGNALGELRSFGDVLGGIGREQTRDLGNLSTIYGFKKGSQSVLPYEADQASREGDLWRLFGDVAKGTGSVATTAGLSRGPAAAASTGGAVGFNSSTSPLAASLFRLY